MKIASSKCLTKNTVTSVLIEVLLIYQPGVTSGGPRRLVTDDPKIVRQIL